MKITIIGTGAYSVGIALKLANKKNNEIILWTENKENVTEFKKTKKLSKIFPNLTYPENIDITDKQLNYFKEEHLKRIELSDAILVVDINNYIGESTNIEIEYVKKNR